MAKRYELTDSLWARIALILSGKAGDPGRTADDNRLFVNGVLWVLRLGALGPTFPRSMASGRSCANASVAGPKPMFGSTCSKL